MAASFANSTTWKTLGKLVVALLGTGVLAAGVALPVVGGLSVFAGREANRFNNTTCNLQESRPPQRTTLYANDGKTVLAVLFSQDRQEVAFDQVPQYLRDALIATEDRRFYSHHGVDIRGLVRSAISTSSGDTQGGSTLTMQYVKQVRYYQAGDDIKKQEAAIAQTIDRKIEDAKCALYLENTLHESKNQILTKYLNIAFFGEHSYGIQTAAQTYFHKNVDQLGLGESATLVGLLRAPTTYDPFLNRDLATKRRNQVLENLVAVGKLSRAQAEVEEAKPIALASDSRQVHQGCFNSETTLSNSAFFCEYAVDWLKSVQKLSPTQLDTGGYNIVTTIDPSVQNSTQQQLSKTIPATSPMTAVVPVLDPKTGNVLAMATSKGYGIAPVVQTEQPVFTKPVAAAASTYKLFPLLQALSTGMPGTLKLESSDAKGIYTTRKCVTKGSTPNDDSTETFTRNETLTSATEKSSNTFFLALTDQMFSCRMTPMVTMAQSLGLTNLAVPSDIRNQTVGEAVINQQRAQQFVLGSIATSPLQMAGAYAAVANGGRFNAPAPIIRITDQDGNPIQVKRVRAVQAIAPQVAAKAIDILVGDTRGDGTSEKVFQSWYDKRDSLIAGKTGTQQADPQVKKNAAVWFVGMTPKYVASTALINFDAPSTPSAALRQLDLKAGAAYGRDAAKVWLSALGPTLSSEPGWSWPDPDTVGSIDVPSLVGQTQDQAERLLAEFGLKLKLMDALTACPSSAALDTVGYYGPSRANAGDTVTVCLSQGIAPHIYVKPKPKPKPKPSPSPGGSTTTTTGSSPAPGGGSSSGGGRTRTRTRSPGGGTGNG